MCSNQKSKEPEFDISPAMTAEELRKAAVKYAQIHSDWYGAQSRRMARNWNNITFATIVLSAVSSVTAAYNLGAEYRFIPAILSAGAALCAAYLTQFRVRDLWQIREAGRIAAEKLVAKAQSVSVDDPQRSYEQAIALRLELHDLERNQTDQFFAVPKN
ncbi:DUF4231 domain-containing protein [Rhizobium rhizogenes]|uniref:DUF4231 domain-containing protein n=1 Tax=Rhizobium rhizogenes TaxID=359 RepID=UPI00103A94C6|nr:DUF4231 domain-containing protein [Rhizobium rhizogenes]NTF82460.1 DUF4231 domain-containing protein [Rhizobium rhizogenes]